jgi:ketosteroid isomerase-like protein
MKHLIATLVCSIGLMGTAAAAEAPDTAQFSAPIHQFIDNFNKGDAAAAAASHATTGLVIIDEVPPYQWQGPDAFKAWGEALAAYDKSKGITDEFVKLGEITRTEVTGDRAYVITDAVYKFKQNGVAMKERAQMTYTMQKTSGGWLITSWTWTGPTPKKAK